MCSMHWCTPGCLLGDTWSWLHPAIPVWCCPLCSVCRATRGGSISEKLRCWRSCGLTSRRHLGRHTTAIDPALCNCRGRDATSAYFAFVEAESSHFAVRVVDSDTGPAYELYPFALPSSRRTGLTALGTQRFSSPG